MRNSRLSVSDLRVYNKRHDVLLYTDLLSYKTEFKFAEKYATIEDQLYFLASVTRHHPQISANLYQTVLHAIDVGKYNFHTIYDYINRCECTTNSLPTPEHPITVDDMHCILALIIKEPEAAVCFTQFNGTHDNPKQLYAHSFPDLFYSLITYWNNGAATHKCLQFLKTIYGVEKIDITSEELYNLYNPANIINDYINKPSLHSDFCYGLDKKNNTATRNRRAHSKCHTIETNSTNEELLQIFYKMYNNTEGPNIVDRLERIFDCENFQYVKKTHRRRRWDSSKVCGWPIISSLAKTIGGECAISPDLDAIRNSLKTTKDILSNHDKRLQLSFEKLVLHDKHIYDLYQSLQNLEYKLSTRIVNSHFGALTEITHFWQILFKHYLQFQIHYNNILAKVNSIRLGTTVKSDHFFDGLLDVGSLLSQYNMRIASEFPHDIIFDAVEFAHQHKYIDDFTITVSLPIIDQETRDHAVFTAFSFPICYQNATGVYKGVDMPELLCDSSFVCVSYPLHLCHSTGINTFICPQRYYNTHHYTNNLVRLATQDECPTVQVIPDNNLYIAANITVIASKCSSNSAELPIEYTIKNAPVLFEMPCGYSYDAGGMRIDRCHCATYETAYYYPVDDDIIGIKFGLEDTDITGQWKHDLHIFDTNITHTQDLDAFIKQNEALQLHSKHLFNVLDDQINSIHGDLESSTFLIYLIIGLIVIFISTLLCFCKQR